MKAMGYELKELRHPHTNSTNTRQCSRFKTNTAKGCSLLPLVCEVCVHIVCVQCVSPRVCQVCVAICVPPLVCARLCVMCVLPNMYPSSCVCPRVCPSTCVCPLVGDVCVPICVW